MVSYLLLFVLFYFLILFRNIVIITTIAIIITIIIIILFLIIIIIIFFLAMLLLLLLFFFVTEKLSKIFIIHIDGIALVHLRRIRGNGSSSRLEGAFMYGFIVSAAGSRSFYACFLIFCDFNLDS